MTDAPAPIGHNEGPTLPALTKPDLIAAHAPLYAEVEALVARGQALTVPADLQGASDAAITAAITSFTGFNNDAVALLRRVDETRKMVKLPYEAVTKAVDGAFNADMRDVIDPVKRRLGVDGGKLVQEQDRRRRAKLEAEAKAAREAEQKRLEEAAALESAGQHTQAGVAMRQAEAQSEDASRRSQIATSNENLGRTYSPAGTATTRGREVVKVNRATVDLEVLRPFLDEDMLAKAAKAWRSVNKNAAAPKGVEFDVEHTLSTRR